MKIYRAYSSNKSFDWPVDWKQNFAANYSGGVFMFEEGAADEAAFVRSCIDRGAETKVTRNEHFAVSLDELSSFQSSFFYLEPDNIDYSGPAFMDQSSGCRLCHLGMSQIKNFAMDPRLAGRLDVGRFIVPPVQIWVVSRRAKEVIVSSGLTGCTFYPCLRTDRKYTPEQMVVGAGIPEIAAEAEHFQMVWNVRTSVKVGQVNFTKVCEACGSVVRGPQMIGALAPRIRTGALVDNDFLYFNDYEASDGVPFKMRGMVRIASGKAMSVLKANKLKGIEWQYLSKPPIDLRMIPFEADAPLTGE